MKLFPNFTSSPFDYTYKFSRQVMFASPRQLKSRNSQNYSVVKITIRLQFVGAIAIVIQCVSSQLESAHNAIHCFSVY